MRAAVSGNTEDWWEDTEKVIQLLLEAGADLNNIWEGQGTALQVAAFWGSELAVKLLLKANADVNLQCEAVIDGVRHSQN